MGNIDGMSIRSLSAVNQWISLVNSNIDGTQRVSYKHIRPVLSDGLEILPAENKYMFHMVGRDSGMGIPPHVLTITKTKIDFSQGNIVESNSEDHMAIQGEGYFILKDHQGYTFFSRDGEFFRDNLDYLMNSEGLYLLDKVMAMNYGLLRTGGPTANQVDTGTAGWQNAQELTYGGINPNDLPEDDPKLIWFPYVNGTAFDEGGGNGYQNMTCLFRKSFITTDSYIETGNELTLEIPPQNPAAAGPLFFDGLGHPLSNLDLNPMATQVYINGKLVKSFAPNTTGITQSYTLTNSEIAPYIQNGMNTIAIRVTEFTDSDGILINGRIGGTKIISDSTWGSYIVGVADSAGFLGVNGDKTTGSYAGMTGAIPYDPNLNYVGWWDGNGNPIGDGAAVFNQNYPTPPLALPPTNDDNHSRVADNDGADPDAMFRMNVTGNRTLVNLEAYITEEAINAGNLKTWDIILGGALPDSNTTVGDYGNVGGTGISKRGAPLAVVVNGVSANVNTGNGINLDINGATTLNLYIPDLDDSDSQVSYFDNPGNLKPIYIRAVFTDKATGITYNEVYVFERPKLGGSGWQPLTTPVPAAIPSSFVGPTSEEFQNLLMPDYDKDIVIARTPSQELTLRYSKYGSTIFEYFPSSSRAYWDSTDYNNSDTLVIDVPNKEGLGNVLKQHLERSNSSLSEDIVELSLAQKMFAAIAKIISVYNSVVDDISSTIR